MLNFARMPLVAAGLVGFAMVAAAIAIAQDNSSSTEPSSGQPASSIQNEGVQTDAQAGQPSSATNPSNLPKTEAGTTEQQSKAPVLDPHASTQNSATDQSASEKAGSAPNTNAQNANTQEWPAPQRYDAGRGASSSRASGRGGATLGVNVVGSEDGQGVVVARIRPGTPAEQMGLRPRDRILSLNGQPVGSVDEFISSIRGMNPGTDIQLSIERDGNARDIGGQLSAFRDAIAVGEGAVGNVVDRAREFIGGERSGRIGDNYRGRENMQTSYENSPIGRQPSRDLESRLSRVEQQIDQLMRDVSEIRAATRPNPSTSSALPAAGAAGQPSTRGPSPFRPTPGQPPSGLPPQSR